MKRFLAAALAAGAILVSAAAADARLVTRRIHVNITGPEIARILRELGYRARLTVDTQGDPWIESSSGGFKFSVRFYRCSKAPVRECKDIQFRSVYRVGNPPSTFKLNKWNRTRRFVYAFRSRDNSVAVKMDLSFDRGLPPAAFRGAVAGFGGAMARFRRFIRN